MMDQQKQKEVFHIAGDTPEEVAAMESDHRGGLQATSTVNLTRTALAHPEVYYRAKDGQEFLLTADLYAFPGEPMKLILFCPLCTRANGKTTLTINGANKKIEYDPTSQFVLKLANGDYARSGRLDVEQFRCTWEADRNAPVNQGGQGVIIAGANRCSWHVVIDRNVARDV